MVGSQESLIARRDARWGEFPGFAREVACLWSAGSPATVTGMPTREQVRTFIDAVVTGNHADAIARFYTDDATMQENTAEPRRGLVNLVDRERKVLDKVASVVTHQPDAVVIDGDRVAIHWIFDFTLADGRTRRVDEVALQTWRGDKIASERFFYDPVAAAVQPAEQ